MPSSPSVPVQLGNLEEGSRERKGEQVGDGHFPRGGRNAIACGDQAIGDELATDLNVGDLLPARDDIADDCVAQIARHRLRRRGCLPLYRRVEVACHDPSAWAAARHPGKVDPALRREAACRGRNGARSALLGAGDGYSHAYDGLGLVRATDG